MTQLKILAYACMTAEKVWLEELDWSNRRPNDKDQKELANKAWNEYIELQRMIWAEEKKVSNK